VSARGAKAIVAGRYLLDTHAFLYLAQFPDRLPPRLRPLIEDGRNELHVSIASLWEIQIKAMTGKLVVGGPLDRLVDIQQRENGVQLLPIGVAHIVEHGALPLHHRDPFDRMLIAQARVEGLTILSSDRAMSAYEVTVRW
jgi:PIN domain nuclease of toxin-antitoxin system